MNAKRRIVGIAERVHGTDKIAVGLELALWVLRDGLPTWEQIRERCECSRATAYRYRKAMSDFLDKQAARAPQKAAA